MGTTDDESQRVQSVSRHPTTESNTAHPRRVESCNDSRCWGAGVGRLGENNALLLRQSLVDNYSCAPEYRAMALGAGGSAHSRRRHGAGTRRRTSPVIHRFIDGEIATEGSRGRDESCHRLNTIFRLQSFECSGGGLATKNCPRADDSGDDLQPCLRVHHTFTFREHDRLHRLLCAGGSGVTPTLVGQPGEPPHFKRLVPAGIGPSVCA